MNIVDYRFLDDFYESRGCQVAILRLKSSFDAIGIGVESRGWKSVSAKTRVQMAQRSFANFLEVGPPSGSFH